MNSIFSEELGINLPEPDEYATGILFLDPVHHQISRYLYFIGYPGTYV